MKVQVMSLKEVNYHEPVNKTAIIRITDGGFELNDLPCAYEKELTLNFYDIEPRVGLPNNWNWFDISDGEILMYYFETIKGCDELVIHCHAGISRSPAIAISYGWYTGDEYIVNQILKGNYIPNKQVLNTMSVLIFKDRKEARKKYQEISEYYTKLVSNNKSNSIKF